MCPARTKNVVTAFTDSAWWARGSDHVDETHSIFFFTHPFSAPDILCQSQFKMGGKKAAGENSKKAAGNARVCVFF
jgi:hypothetical protein